LGYILGDFSQSHLLTLVVLQVFEDKKIPLSDRNVNIGRNDKKIVETT
jgi:hypothetical protein